MQQCVTYFCLGRALRCAAVRLFAASPRGAKKHPCGLSAAILHAGIVLMVRDDTNHDGV